VSVSRDKNSVGRLSKVALNKTSREGTESQRERVSCDNMFLTRFTAYLPDGRGLVFARVITFPMMLSVLLLPEPSGESGVTAKRACKGRIEKRKAESATSS